MVDLQKIRGNTKTFVPQPKMALVSGRSSSSTLNPDAPLFIPAAFRQVEDFSPAWWKLITTSTWYHDYWISQNPDGLNDPTENDDVLNLLPDSIDFIEAQFEEFIQCSEAEAKTFSPMGGKGINNT